MITPRDWGSGVQWSWNLESDLVMDLDKEFNEFEVTLSVIVNEIKSSLINDVSNSSLRYAGICVLVKLIVDLISEDSLTIEEISYGSVTVDASLDVSMKARPYPWVGTMIDVYD